MSNYKAVLEKLGISNIHDEELFRQAFSHSSYINERKTKDLDYERIEFVGDGVLDLVVADLIYKMYPKMDQGIMTKFRAKLVQGISLADHARKLNLGSAIRLGQGEAKNGGNDSNKILEDVFEALMGAIYLDQGFETVYKIIKKIFNDDLTHLDVDSLTDYKSKLQEDVQTDRRGSVTYVTILEDGDAQHKQFIVEARYEGVVLGRGKGSSKRKAEQEAAKDALSKRA